MTGALLLKNGLLVTREGRRRTDLLAVDGRIAATGKDIAVPSGTRSVDIDGLTVLPGVIDPHTHFWEEGFAAEPDFRDGSLSAVRGGITTIIDMPLTEPCVLDADTFHDKVALGLRTSQVDFALFGGVGPDNIEKLEPMWRAGAAALKIFTCETGCAMAGLVEDADLRRALQRIASFGGLAALHSEDQRRLDNNLARLVQAGRTEAAAYSEWHDETAELSAMQRIIDHAKNFGTRINIVHVTSPAGVDLLAAARAAGVAATAETCPHYLFLGEEDIAVKGGRLICAPPVRARERIAAMRQCVDNGLVFTIGTDHCAVHPARKQLPPLQAQPGMPGLETMVPLLLDLVAHGALTLERMVEITSYNTARLYGLYPQKGSMRIGADADFTIVDPDHTWTIEAADLAGSAGWTPFEGLSVRGRVEMTIIRGRIAARGRHALIADRPAAFIPRQS